MKELRKIRRKNISRHKRDGQRTNGKLLPYGGR